MQYQDMQRSYELHMSLRVQMIVNFVPMSYNMAIFIPFLHQNISSSSAVPTCRHQNPGIVLGYILKSVYVPILRAS